MSQTAILPDRLRPGDQVVVVSPSSTIAAQRDTAERARGALEQALTLKIRFSEHALADHYYSSGTPEQRRQDLMAAFTDPNVSAIFLSMGGATAIDMIDGLEYEVIAANPKIVTGISDSCTVLNAITTKTGLITFHGLEMFDYARHEMPYTTASMQRVWFEGWAGTYAPNPRWRDLDGETTTYRSWREIKAGQASGITVGGNSEALVQLIGSDYCPCFEQAILVLETYRLQKRHLHALLISLRLRGIFDAIAGLIMGYCLGSDVPGIGNDRDLADIVRETTHGYDFPVLQIGEIGHQVENLILPLGAMTHLDTRGPSLILTAPAVT